MIQWLQNYAGIKSSGQNIEQAELENLRKEIKHYKKKYANEDKEMEIQSDDSEEVSKEEQEKINAEIAKRQQKKRGFRQSVSAEVYGFHNKKEDYVPRVIPKTEQQKKNNRSKVYAKFYLQFIRR